MSTTGKSESRPRKGRPPKTPKNVDRRWTDAHGWRYRARVRHAELGQQVGGWRENVDDAEQDRDAILERIGRAQAVDELPTVHEGLRLFLERARERGFRPRVVAPCSAGTVRHYAEIAAVIYDHTGADLLLQDVDVTFISGFLRDRLAEKRVRCRCAEKNEERAESGRRPIPCSHAPTYPSRERMNKVRLVWGLVFRTAIEAGLHPGPNPVDRVDRFATTTEEARFYTAQQVGQILATIRADVKSPTAAWFADAVSLLFLTGLRIGELAHVQVRHVDRDAGTLRVPAGKTGSRTIPLRPPHLEVLERLLDGKGRDAFLLPGETHAQRSANLKSNTFPRWRQKLPESLRDGFTAHAMRHSFQTHLLEHGAPVHHVRALMGHSRNRDITSRYAHVDGARLRQTMANAFDEISTTLWHETAPAGESVTG